MQDSSGYGSGAHDMTSECHEQKLVFSTRPLQKVFSWDLTFDMSGGAKGAERPLGRLLDGGVMFHTRRSSFAEMMPRMTAPKAPKTSRIIALGFADWDSSISFSSPLFSLR